MSQAVPTVRVKSTASPSGFVVINADDITVEHELVAGDDVVIPAIEKRNLTDSIVAKILSRRANVSVDEWYGLPIEEQILHMRSASREIDEAGLPDDGSEPRVAKGPGGRIYIKRGKETVSGPYDTVEAAKAAMAPPPPVTEPAKTVEPVKAPVAPVAAAGAVQQSQ